MKITEIDVFAQHAYQGPYVTVPIELEPHEWARLRKIAWDRKVTLNELLVESLIDYMHYLGMEYPVIIPEMGI